MASQQSSRGFASRTQNSINFSQDPAFNFLDYGTQDFGTQEFSSLQDFPQFTGLSQVQEALLSYCMKWEPSFFNGPSKTFGKSRQSDPKLATNLSICLVKGIRYVPSLDQDSRTRPAWLLSKSPQYCFQGLTQPETDATEAVSVTSRLSEVSLHVFVQFHNAHSYGIQTH